MVIFSRGGGMFVQSSLSGSDAGKDIEKATTHSRLIAVFVIKLEHLECSSLA